MFAMTASQPAKEVPFLTISEAAARAGLARNSVVEAMKTGRLPTYRTATQYGHTVLLVAPEDVDALWAKRPAINDRALARV